MLTVIRHFQLLDGSVSEIIIRIDKLYISKIDETILHKFLKRRPHCKFSVYSPAFSNKIMSKVIIIGSILIIFGYSEAYGQTMANTADDGGSADDGESTNDGVGESNTTRSDIIDCLVNTCITPNFQLPSNTSVIAMAFVNLTLEDIQDYKEVLKSEVSEHINDTIDNLATGRGFNFSICPPPEYRFELPCPLINGIIIPPQNLTTVE
jgi:hypothetical protein